MGSFRKPEQNLLFPNIGEPSDAVQIPHGAFHNIVLVGGLGKFAAGLGNMPLKAVAMNNGAQGDGAAAILLGQVAGQQGGENPGDES